MPNIDELTVKFNQKGVGTVIKNINNLANAVSGLATKSSSLDTQKISALASALGQMKNVYPNKNQVTNLDNLANAIAHLNTAVGSGDITGFATNLNTVSNALGNMKGNSAKKELDKVVSSLRQTSEEAKKTSSSLSGATNKGGFASSKKPKAEVETNASDVAAKFAEANQMIEKTTINVSKFKQALVGAKVLVPTNKMKNLQEETEKARIKYNELRESIRKALAEGELKGGSKQLKNKEKELDGLRQKYDDLILKQKQLALEGNAFKINPNFGKAFDGIKQSVNGVKQAFGGIGSAIKSANGYINTFISKIRGIGSASKKSKKEVTSLSDTVKKLANEVTRLSKMLKLMITRMALRAVIKEVGNGFKSLALHCQEFDQNMSNLINSSKTLGYSFAGMVEPLINALAPALIYIINLITKAVNAINQLFSALGGGTVWHKAKDFTGSWADSIKKANGAAKELKKTVLGFDELNQLQDNKNKGGGSGKEPIVDMFEDMPINDKIQDIAKKIKDIAKKLFDPIKKAWDKLGTYVKNSWKYAMDEVWKLAKKVGEDFLKVWSQRETERIFENILVIIAKIGQTVGNLARQFRLAWSENDTGLHILEHIRNIILIITEHIRNMAIATADWAGKLNFTPLLTAVEQWLASLEPVFDAIMGVIEDFYKEVVLKFTKWVIESGLPELIKVFQRFNEEVKWDELREKLNKVWQHLEPFMETVGEGLIIFIERVTKKIAEFVNGEKFEEFLQFIEDWMDSVTPEEVADAIEKLVLAIAGLKIAGLVVSGLSGLATVLGALVTVGKGIAGIVGGITSFAGAITGLGTALLPVIVAIAAIVVLFYSFIESYGGVEEAFGKLRDVAKEVGDNLKETARQAGLLPSEFEPSQSAVDNLKDSFSDLGTALGNCKGLWDSFFLVLGTGIETIGNYVIPVLSDLIQLIADFTEGLSGMVQAWSGFADVLIGFFTGDSDRVKSGSEDLWNGIKTSATSGKDVVVDAGKAAGDALVAPFRGTWKTLNGEGLLANVLGSYDKVAEKQTEAGSLADKLSEKNTNLGTSLGKLGELHKETNEKFKTHNDVMNEMRQKHDDVKGSLDPLRDAINNTKDSTEKLTTKFNENKGAASDNIEELKKVREALTFTKDAEKELVEYSPEIEKSFEDIRKQMDLTSDDAKETGENIVEGVKEPMKNAKFDSEAKSFYVGLKESLENVFGIASPAKNMKPIGENILLGVDEGFKDSMGAFTDTMKDFYDNYVKTWFDKDTWSFDGVAEGLKNTFEGAKDAIKGVWNGIADKLNGEHEIGESKIHINLPKFARGGFVEDGLFLANHSELVGEFSNGRTAVANNAMIVEGIQAGVYKAVVSAMGQQSNGGYISNEIIVDGEVIARTITRAQEKTDRRYSPQTV